MKLVSRGELGYRLTQSYSRLECEHYLPEVVWTKDPNSWPGDWEGRTMLGLISLAKATGKEPSYLEDILELLPEHLNARGYMGEIYPDGMISEQQLAGNGWLLRALVDYTLWKNTDRLIPCIETIVRNLYLPVLENVKDYPTEMYDKEGEYSGSIIAIRGKWMLSTDVGCAYISLDGISAAYQLLGWPELGTLLEKMIEKFSQTDLYGLQYQTHASLSATRGILRTYTLTGERKYLELAQRVLNLYLAKGQTENFSNRNRFQTCNWTEPCGFIDAYICCVEMYKLTGNAAYVAAAQKIYFNSISHGQLANGGFGLEYAVSDNEKLGFLKHRETGEAEEAFWCCTMRGGDGLAYVSQNQCLIENDAYTFLQYFDSEITRDDVTLTIKSWYPTEGRVRFDIRGIGDTPLTLKLFVPDYVSSATVTVGDTANIYTPENGFISVTVAADGRIVLTFDIPLLQVECIHEHLRADYCKWMHGYLLLAVQNGDENMGAPRLTTDGQYVFGEDVPACYLNKTVFNAAEYAKNENLTIRFKKP